MKHKNSDGLKRALVIWLPFALLLWGAIIYIFIS